MASVLPSLSSVGIDLTGSSLPASTSASRVPPIVISNVSLLLPKNIEGGRDVVTAGGFFVSKRLKSADEPFVGLSARIVSLATDVEAVDFLGQVPYQLLFDFNCDKFR